LIVDVGTVVEIWLEVEFFFFTSNNESWKNKNQVLNLELVLCEVKEGCRSPTLKRIHQLLVFT